MKKFKSSYNSEDDVLYIYEPKKKSKESIEHRYHDWISLEEQLRHKKK